MSKCIKKSNVFIESLMIFMKLDDTHAIYIIQTIHSNYEQYLKRFEDADSFATLSYRVLKEQFSFNVKEVAAQILNYVAYEVGRFSAQHKIDNLIENGIEPMIESILET